MVRRFYMLTNMIRFVIVVALFSVSGLTGFGQAATQKRPDAPQLAPHVPTGHDVVDRMLSLAGVTKADFVVDLGCGDGRIPIAAAKKYGARGLGVDIDPVRIQEANANLKAAGVQNLVEFRLQDALTTDVSNATV